MAIAKVSNQRPVPILSDTLTARKMLVDSEPMRTIGVFAATVMLTFAYTALYEMVMRRLRPDSFRPAETQEDVSNDGCQTSIAMLLLGCLAFATVLGVQFVLER